MIKVLLFANLRDLAGSDQLEIALDGIVSVRDLTVHLSELHPNLGPVLADGSAMISINKKYAQWDAPLTSGDEVGILPPVSGG